MKKFHCCLDIEGGIKRAKDLKGCITVDGKILTDVSDIKKIPERTARYGEKKSFLAATATNFDYQTGCKGHDVEDKETHHD